MLKHIALSDCEICGKLDRSTYANIISGESLPAAAEELVGDTVGHDMFENLSVCPHCGTFYKNTNDCGFMENDVLLWRVSPTSIGEALSKEDLHFFEGLLSGQKRDKEYAAECLFDHYLSEKNWAELEKLFQHSDRELRLLAVVHGLGVEEAGITSLYVRSIQSEKDAQVRMNALRFFSYNLPHIEAALSFLVGLLKDGSEGMRRDASEILKYYSRNGGKQKLDKELKRQKVKL